MSKRAIIYTRVSTDDQADRGYSLAYQEERLRKYCEVNDIEVVAHYQDDHSAKTFVRPAFNKLLKQCKKERSKIDLLLFINWSRFSRNTKLTYMMMDEFQQLGIDLCAIDQPLDLSVPENKMMLAFYITSNEVENDRRSLNVLMGMYRAKKEGRWTTIAPIGYRNIREENGKAMIVPDHNADIVREAFTEFAKGIYGVEELRIKLSKKGLKCSRARFPELLRNHVYISKIFVPAYKDEPAYYASGIHEPLIDEELFMQVQNILKGRAPNRPAKNTVRDEFPLRGFLRCRRCEKNISASASRGNGGKYFYYHCTCGCPERFKAGETNSKFIDLLKGIRVIPEAITLFTEFLKDKFSSSNRSDLQALNRIEEEIRKNTVRIQNAQRMMLDETISVAEYQEIKLKYEAANASLLEEKKSLENNDSSKRYIQHGVELLKQPDQYYSQSSITIKQLIISSLFNGRLTFNENKFDDILLNSVLHDLRNH
jgi:site-specific DNA recombinase